MTGARGFSRAIKGARGFSRAMIVVVIARTVLSAHSQTPTASTVPAGNADAGKRLYEKETCFFLRRHCWPGQSGWCTPGRRCQKPSEFHSLDVRQPAGRMPAFTDKFFPTRSSRTSSPDVRSLPQAKSGQRHPAARTVEEVIQSSLPDRLSASRETPSRLPGNRRSCSTSRPGPRRLSASRAGAGPRCGESFPWSRASSAARSRRSSCASIADDVDRFRRRPRGD